MGYAARWDKPATSDVHDDLYAKALYLQSGKTSLLLISLDLCELAGAESLQADIRAATQVQHVLISVTHTHSGPYTCPTAALPDAVNPDWLVWMRTQVLAAAEEAAANTFPAKFGAAQAMVSEVGKNRRAGHTVTDPALTVATVTDEHNTVRALLINYACHSTVLDGNNFKISADYPGFLYTFLSERYPDAQVMFTNGAAGDINIGYSSDASALGEAMAFRSFDKAKEVAETLGSKALGLLGQMSLTGDTPLAVLPVPVRLPLRENRPEPLQLKSMADEEAARAQSAPTPQERRAAAIRGIYHLSLLDSLALAGDGDVCMANSLLIRLGNLVLITTPSELFCEVGLAVKALLPAGFMGAVIGYAGGYVGYLPTEAAMAQGGYEAEVSPFAPHAATVWVDAIKSAIASTGLL